MKNNNKGDYLERHKAICVAGLMIDSEGSNRIRWIKWKKMINFRGKKIKIRRNERMSVFCSKPMNYQVRQMRGGMKNQCIFCATVWVRACF